MGRFLFCFILVGLIPGFVQAQSPSKSNKSFFLPGKPPAQTPELTIEQIVDAQTLQAAGFAISPAPGQVLAVRSAESDSGVIGFVEVEESEIRRDGKVQVRARVLRMSRYYIVRPGDTLAQLDLTGDDPLYRGHTELFVRGWSGPDISSKYRPLFTQGFSIGETAQTLKRDEVLVGIFGQLSYGLSDRWTIGSLLSGFLLDSPNGNLKFKALDTSSDTLSLGLSVTKTKASEATALNLTIYWDSITSDKMVSHALATFAIASLTNFEDTVAIRGAGSSTFQTGYEYVLDNWDRVLFGPNYNFELQALGGYVAYKRIWNDFHLMGSLATVDLRELRFDKTGYVALVEAYWRF